MPILWIRETSPMTVVVESDDGTELSRMEVEGVRGRDATWKITEADEPGNAPVSNRGFRMRRRQGSDGEEFVLKIEFGRGGGSGDGPRR